MAGEPAIPNVVIRVLTALLALGAAVGFVIIFGKAITDVWGAKAGVPPTQNDAFLYVATAIATLVGGVVALGFGVQIPPDEVKNATLMQTSTRALGALVWPNATTVRSIIGSIYAVVYILLGAAAVVAWITHAPETSPLVKNLATTFVALIIPIINGYLRAND